MSLPNWLVASSPEQLMPAKKRRYRGDYLEKTLQSIQSIMAEDMYQTRFADQKGLLQSIDPRIKTIGLLLLLLTVAGSTSMTSLIIVHLLLAIVVIASNLSLWGYLRRTWLLALVFAGLAVLPAIFSWVTPGYPVVVVYQGGGGFGYLPGELSITAQGLKAAGMVLLRCTASLGLAVLLVKTTHFAVLTKALQSLGLPGLIVMVLDLTYRYLFLFLLLLNDYLFGRRSRVVGKEDNRDSLTWIGGALAGFFRLTGEYTKEIFLAMQARGYTGESRHNLSGRLRQADVLFILVIILVCIGIWGGTRFDGIYGF